LHREQGRSSDPVKPASFAYYAPRSLDEALALLAEIEGAKPLAGGQSLMPLLNLRLARAEALVDLSRIPELWDVRADEESLTLGALVRHATLAADPRVRRTAPILAEAARFVGHLAIRNRGTLGGSLAHADPAAELPAACLAHGAFLHLLSRRGERTVPVEAFFHGPFLTDLAPDELLVAVRLPLDPSPGYAVVEVARRPGDFALAGAAVLLHEEAGVVKDPRFVLFGVGDRPFRVSRLEANLEGLLVQEARRCVHSFDEELLEEVEVVGDLHAGADYRRHLAVVVLRRAANTALGRLGGRP
jgi:carbon-monoxide dehydrogenase medium subunit